MKTLLSSLSLGLILASGALAQSQPGGTPTPDKPVLSGDSARAGAATRFSDAMKNLPADVLDKINSARSAADAAKAQIEAMKTQGKTPEEIQAMISERRTAALANLQKALDALSNLPSETKERVGKAKEAISTRMNERKGEAVGTP